MQDEVRFSPRMENLIKKVFKRFGVGITSYSRLEQLGDNYKAAGDLQFLLAQPDDHAATALKLLKKSRSQFRQDLFALLHSNCKRGGFFVEFGATNGVDISNTWLLEKEYGWTGILAEPAKIWHESLRQNRMCTIETRCVWHTSGATMDFNEVKYAELSTLSEYSSTDNYKRARAYGKTYGVETISLVDLLDEYNAPRDIDYLSVDTEGSEFDILANFDFAKYRFNAISCEHNYTPKREQIRELLASKGYVLRFENLSHSDDWFVKN